MANLYKKINGDSMLSPRKVYSLEPPDGEMSLPLP